jgi:hypothetical protein
MGPTDEPQRKSYRIYPGKVTSPLHDDARKYNARAVNHRFSPSSNSGRLGRESCAGAFQRIVKKVGIKFNCGKLLLLLFLDF